MLYFDLTNIGKYKKNILKSIKKILKLVNNLSGGGWTLGVVGQN